MRRRAAWVVLASVAALPLCAPAAGDPRRAEADSCTVYAYIDGGGQLIKTVSRQAVPPAFSASLMTFEDCEQARALADQGGTETKGASPNYTPESGDQPQAARERSSRTESKILTWFTSLSPWKGILLIFCWAVGVAGGFGVLITAFKTSIWWGLGSLLLPLVSLIFVILYWRLVWPSFLANLLGGGIAAGLLFAWSAPLPY